MVVDRLLNRSLKDRERLEANERDALGFSVTGVGSMPSAVRRFSSAVAAASLLRFFIYELTLPRDLEDNSRSNLVELKTGCKGVAYPLLKGFKLLTALATLVDKSPIPSWVNRCCSSDETFLFLSLPMELEDKTMLLPVL